MKFEDDVDQLFEAFQKKVDSINENASGEYLVRAYGQVLEQIQEEKINLQEDAPKDNDYLTDEPFKEVDELIATIQEKLDQAKV